MHKKNNDRVKVKEGLTTLLKKKDKKIKVIDNKISKITLDSKDKNIETLIRIVARCIIILDLIIPEI